MEKVPVTVGLARSKTLAKLISDSAKPFGAKAVLDRQAEVELLAARPVTEISGIAGRREKRLSPWGITTCMDLANADRRRLVRQLLTVKGEALWWELNGESVLPINPRRVPHKMISRGGSFGEPTDKPDGRERRDDRIGQIVVIIYDGILRAERRWWQHPRWHIHHRRLQVHPWQQLPRRYWDKCCKCGVRGFPKGVDAMGDWSGKRLWHSTCDGRAAEMAPSEAA